jgi:hypothetical protein
MKTYIQCCLWILILVVSLPVLSIANDEEEVQYIKKNPEGTEFWLLFQQNFQRPEKNKADKQTLQLFITSDYDDTITVSIDAINFLQRYVIKKNIVQTVKLPNEAQFLEMEIARKMAIHVESTKPIMVYCLNHKKMSTDTYLGLPVNVLGNSYRAVAMTVIGEFVSQIGIVATQDSTIVEIVPTYSLLSGRPGNVPFKIVLQKGEAYQFCADDKISSRNDLTGTLVIGNKPIAVFSGHQCANVPVAVGTCNHLVEQLPPISSWGKQFYVGQFKGRSKSTYRILANENNTVVFEDNKQVAVLKAGQFYENNNLRSVVQVNATKPILVTQYSQGMRNGDSLGDPMMLLVSPTQQFLKKYRFATPVSGSWKHFINVVVPTAGLSSLKLDSAKVDENQFKQIGMSNYSFGAIQIPFGTHFISADVPFGLYSYGSGFNEDNYDAYGNIGGQSFLEIDSLNDEDPPILQDKIGKKGIDIIVKDDRSTDLGLEKVSIVYASNLQTKLPTIISGMSQASFTVEAISPNEIGRMIIQAVDVKGNIALFTVCYTSDDVNAGLSYTTCDGDKDECLPRSTFFYGAMANLGYTMQTTDFASNALLPRTGPSFGDASGFGGYGSLFFGKRINQQFSISANLSFSSLGGTFNSPDSSTSSVFDQVTGTVVPLQESTLLTNTSLYTNFGISGEWYFAQPMYIKAGVTAAIPFIESVSVQQRIDAPASFNYPNNSKITETNISTIGGFTPNFMVNLGVGALIPLTYTYNGVFEANYVRSLTSISSESDWNFQQLQFNFGVRIRL